MLPVLYKFTFDTPGNRLVLYLVAAGLVFYGAFSGWRGALDAKEAPKRAVGYGLFALVIAVVGLQYAFPAGFKPLPFLPTVHLPFIDFDLNGTGKNYGVPLHTYGILIATSFIISIVLCSREALRAYPEQRRVEGKWVPLAPIMRDHILDLAFYVLVSGLVGSRLVFIIVNWKDYRSLGDVLSISGGLVWYGGFIGAALTVLWYSLKYKIDFLRIADLINPAVAISHAVGRFACFSAGCCWGHIAAQTSKVALRFPSAANLPFGGFGTDSLAYSDQIKDQGYAILATGEVWSKAVPGAVKIADEAIRLGTTLPVYPTQLFESLGEIVLFSVLLLVRREKRFHGQVFATWLCCYAILRTIVEQFRGDKERGFIFKFLDAPETAWWNLSTSQFISLLIFSTGLYVFYKYGRTAVGGRPTPQPA